MVRFDSGRGRRMHRQSILSVALVVLLVGAGAMGAIATQPSIDTETADTTSTSELTDGSTIDVSDGINESQAHALQYTADSENSKVEITLNGTDDEGGTVFYSNSSATTVDSASDTYRVTISESELAAVPVAVNQNRTLDVTITNDTTAANPDTKTIQVDLVNGGERSVVYVSGDDDEAIGEDDSTIKDWVGGLFGPDDPAERGHIESEREITGQNTTLYYYFANETVADAFEEAASDNDDGERVGDTVVDVSDHDTMVFKNEPTDEDWLNDDEGYAVIHTDTNPVSLTIHPGSYAEDESELEVTTESNVWPGFVRRFLMNWKYKNE